MFYLEDLVKSPAYRKADESQREQLRRGYFERFIAPRVPGHLKTRAYSKLLENAAKFEDVEMQKSDIMTNLLEVGPSLTTTGMLMSGEAPTPPEAENMAVEMARSVAPLVENIVVGAGIGIPASAVGGPLAGTALGFAAGPVLNEAVRQSIETGKIDTVSLLKTAAIEGTTGIIAGVAGKGGARLAAKALGVTSKAVPILEKTAEGLAISVAPQILRFEPVTFDSFIHNAVPALSFIGIGSVTRVAKWGAPKMNEIAKKRGVSPSEVQAEFAKLPPKEMAEVLKNPNLLERKFDEIAKGISMGEAFIKQSEAAEKGVPVTKVKVAGKVKASELGFAPEGADDLIARAAGERDWNSVKYVPEGMTPAQVEKVRQDWITEPAEPNFETRPYEPKAVRDNFIFQMKDSFNLSDTETRVMAAILDARAMKSGMKPEEWYSKRIADVVLGGDPEVGALYNTDTPNLKDMNRQEFIDYYTKYRARDDSKYDQAVVDFYNSILSRSGGDDAVHFNQKTGGSVDVSAVCPMNKLMRTCFQCYVGEGRDILTVSTHKYLQDKGIKEFESYNIINRDEMWGYRADGTGKYIEKIPVLMKKLKAAGYRTPYNNPTGSFEAAPYDGSLARMPKPVVKFFNEKMGGFRMYSWGDFQECDIATADRVIADAQSVGLTIKIITGQKEAVERWRHHDNVVFNLSVEYSPLFSDAHGKTIRENLRGTYNKKGLKRTKEEIDRIVETHEEFIRSGAAQEKFPYEWAVRNREPGKIMIRYTAMNREEFIRACADPNIDVVTPYHGPVDPDFNRMRWELSRNYADKLNSMGRQGKTQTYDDLIDGFSAMYRARSKTVFNQGKPFDFAFKEKEVMAALMKSGVQQGRFRPTMSYREWLDAANQKTCCLNKICARCNARCGQGPFSDALVADVVGRYFEGEHRGSVEFLGDGRAIIRALKNPSFSVLAHETGHIFRRDVFHEASPKNQALLNSIEKHYGIKGGKWEVAHEEAFAKDFERYVRENYAPTPAARSVFKMFKDWIVAQYKRLRGADVDLGEESARFFDEMLGIEQGKRKEFFKQAEEYVIEPKSEPGPGTQSQVEAMLTMMTGRFYSLYDHTPLTKSYGDNQKPHLQYHVKVKEGQYAGKHDGVFATEAQGRALQQQVKNYTETKTKNYFLNPIYALDKVPVLKDIYYKLREAEHYAVQNYKVIRDFAEKQIFNLPKKSLENIGAFLTSLQDGGPERLAAMGVKEIKKLNAKELRAVQYMRDMYDAKIDQINLVRLAIGKEPIPKLPHYFTQMVVFNDFLAADINPVFLSTDQFIKPRGVPEPMAHHRVGGTRAVELNAKDVFLSYMKDAERIIQVSPMIAQGRLLTERSWELGGRKWRLKFAEPGAYKFFSEWLDYEAGKGKVGTYGHLPTFMERAMHTLQKNARTGVMSFYLPSALKQPLAYINTVADCGFKASMQGAIENLSASRRNFAMQTSRVLKNREVDVSMAEAYDSAKTPIGGALNVVTKYGFAPLRLLDMETARSTWLAGYAKGKAKGLTGRDLVNFADDMVVRGQGSASRLDVSPVQRTELGRFMTLFQTFAIADWNHLRKDVLGIKADIPKGEIIQRTLRLLVATELANMAWLAATGRPAIPTPLSTAIEVAQSGEIKPEDIPKILMSVGTRLPVVGSWEYGTVAPGAQYAMNVVEGLYKGDVNPFDVMTLAGIPGSQQMKRIVKMRKDSDKEVEKLMRELE